MTDKILTGRWRGYLHARLTGPLAYYRIVYSHEGNESNEIITFTTIGRKNDLGIS